MQLPYANSMTILKSVDDILCDIDFIKKGRKEFIGNVASVFDIEATSFYKNGEKQCCMYAWVFGLNGRCIIGRTWNEFFECINKVIKFYQLNLNKRIIVYVHNLSYEFQWFRKYFEWEKVFSVDDRKPVYAITKNGIEFRCSYLLTGYNLDTLGKNLKKYKVEKKVGDLDYNLIRHSKTPLTDKELGYILHDGLVVMSHIQEEIERLGTIIKLPITKTGYVRELFRENCIKGDNRWDYTRLIRELTLEESDYRDLKLTYAGGFTHANINYIDRILNDVASFDFTSSYPAVMLSEKYPMSRPFYYAPKNEKEFAAMLKMFCCMFKCHFHNIVAKVNFENYISYSKCINIEHYVLNNGRVIEATDLDISLTEQDFILISKMYKWDYVDVYDIKCYDKDYLPKDFILTVLELYKDKTELKGVEGKEVEYMVSKENINSSYGMTVTDPCRTEITYENNNWGIISPDIEDLLYKYNKNNNRFLYYPWGVWITAYARANLFSGILEFGNDYIYSDTDSIKVLNYDKHKNYIDDYNKKIKEKVAKCLSHYDIPVEYSHPKTKNNIEKPIGVWDFEGVYSRFKTLGAKRYITEKEGNISITIAGVGKEAGAKYLKYKYKTNDNIFKAFKEDLVFPPHYDHNGIDENGSGKLCHTYIDYRMCGEIIDYMGNISEYLEESGVHLENTDYTLNLDDDFIKLFMGMRLDYIDENCKLF